MNEITISVEELINLLDRSHKLRLLERAGVDNWDGYDFAFEDEEESDD